MTGTSGISIAPPGRLLIVRLGSLGDAVISIPSLRIISRWLSTFAQPPPVTVLGREFGQDIFPRALPIDRFFNFGSLELLPLFSSNRGLPEATFDLLGQPDVAIIWLRDYQEIAAKLRDAGCRLVLAGDSFPEDSLTHMSDHLRSLVGPLGIVDRDEKSLPITSSERHEGLTLVDRKAGDRAVALIHPGSGSPKKNWPASNYAALMGELADERWELRVLQGPADAASVANLEEALRGRTPTIIAPGSVGDLCGALSAVDLVVSNDSGVAHLSAALGRPTVAVFGPTNVFRWAPRGPAAVTVPPSPGSEWPSVEAVGRGCTKAIGSLVD